jgi:oxygen-independent coproporphyrinogen-3 oxidase
MKEISERTHEITGTFDSVYFGGGTPSVLSAVDIRLILDQLSRYYPLSDDAEVTLEANPDDINSDFLEVIASDTIINRFSLGIQSFNDRFLHEMNRRHDSVQAIKSLNLLKTFGFDNISLDLIYGLPGLSIKEWEQQILKALEFQVPHISAYHLTSEPGTVFYQRLKKGVYHEMADTESIKQFDLLRTLLANQHYEHYEISNFARKGLYSWHNMKYWNDSLYLGFGPGAHSFNGLNRRWNVQDMNSYLAGNRKKKYYEMEVLTDNERYNEILMTRLRTKWGLDFAELCDFYEEKLMSSVCHNKYVERGLLEISDNVIRITDAGKYLSDQIISELFIIE